MASCRSAGILPAFTGMTVWAALLPFGFDGDGDYDNDYDYDNDHDNDTLTGRNLPPAAS